MHIAVVTQGVPEPDSGGSALIHWGLLHALRAAGHRNTAWLIVPRDEQRRDGFDRRLAAVEALGTRTVVHTLSDSAADYPAAELAEALVSEVHSASPDAVYVFDCGSAQALRRLQDIPRMAVLGDPLFLVRRHRLRYTGRWLGRSLPSELLTTMIADRPRQRAIVDAVRGYDEVGWYGPQHAAWLRAQGLACAAIHPPVIDHAGPAWAQRRAELVRRIPRVVLLGHLLGTASLSGLYPFVRTVLPALERRFGAEGFEAHLIGRDEPPADLAEALWRPSVRLRGYVADLAQELLAADVFIAPGAYPVGVRLRIVMALSFGCCVVAHRLSAEGIPELVDGENCLLAGSARELADAALRALGDPVLRGRFGHAARATYERHFSVETAGAQLVGRLERLARGRREAPLGTAVEHST